MVADDESITQVNSRRETTELEADKREDPNVLRIGAYYVRGSFRSSWNWFSFRNIVSWFSILRRVNSSVGRQEIIVIEEGEEMSAARKISEVYPVNRIKGVLEPVDIIIPCKSKIKKWAFENAYTLIFLAFMFIVTWVIMIIVAVTNA